MDTAVRVLAWAIAGQAGPPPTGDLSRTSELAEPSAAAASAASRLAAVMAARLRLSSPPLGDPRPLTPAVIVMAAVIGARSYPIAADLLSLCSPSASAAELLARHGLTEAVIMADGADREHGAAIVPLLRDASPLTGLLQMHGPAGPSRCEHVLDMLLGHSEGRSLVTLALAAPPATGPQSGWRGELLDAMVSDDPGWVLDVYETAMCWHAQEHLELVRAAGRRLGRLADVTAARPVAIWWQALARLDRSHHELLRARTALVGYRTGLNLYWDVWRLGGLR